MNELLKRETTYANGAFESGIWVICLRIIMLSHIQYSSEALGQTHEYILSVRALISISLSLAHQSPQKALCSLHLNSAVSKRLSSHGHI